MNRIWAIFIMGILGVFIEGCILQLLVPAHFVPHLLVFPLLLLGFYELSVSGAVQAFILGLLLDFSSASLVGPWAGAFVSTYACVALMSQRLFVESWMVSCVAVVGASLGIDLLYGALTVEFRPLGGTFLWDALRRALVAGVIAPPTLTLCRRLYRGVSGVPSSYAAQNPI